MVRSCEKSPLRLVFVLVALVMLRGAIRVELEADEVRGPVAADSKPSPAVPDVFLPAPRELIQQLDHAKRALRRQHYSDAVSRLGDLLHNSETEDYFISDCRQPGRMISLKAEAQRILGGMAPDGHSAYELRFGAEARRLLDGAVAESDIDRLIGVSRKYFHTDAGQTATLLLGRYHLDRGHPLAAALTLQRLSHTTRSPDYEPELSMSLALAWLYAGLDDHAEQVLKHLSAQVPLLGIEGAKLPESAQGNVEATIHWLNEQIVSRQQVLGSGENEWLVFRGNASRTARSRGDIPLVVSENPLVNCRWRVAISNNAGMENELKKIQRQYLTAGLPALPTLFPLAVGDVVLMRTPRYMFAVDSTTGKRIWLYDDLSSQLADDAFSGSIGTRDNSAHQNLLTGWHQRMWEDVPYGQMSSDGTNVYLINKLGYSTNLKVLVIKNGFNVRNPLSLRSYNELVALELATEGKRKWVVGGDRGEDEAQLAGAFFLGAPLPIADELYALVEINGEISLVVLAASTGELVWKQPLIHTDESSGSIRVNSLRRTAGAAPSFADGVLVCPTSAGAVVAIDIATRSLLWGFQYDVKNGRRNTRLWNLQHASTTSPPPGSRWGDAAATIVQGKVVMTPVESDFIYCLRLLDGRLLWKRQRKANLFVACVHNDKVVLGGKNAIAGLNLQDGKSAWESPVEIPQGAMPSGRGFVSNGYYFQPTTARDMLKIDLAAGTIVQRTSTGSILGNLICFDDCVISQNVDHLTSFHQVGALRERVGRQLAAHPDDALAMTESAQLLLNDNQRQQALEVLRRSYGLQPNDATRALLVDTLLKGLEEDFAANERLATEVEELIDQPAQRTEYLRLMTIGLHQVGKLADAFAAGVKFIDSGVGKTELERLAENWQVRRDRWIQVHLSNIFDAAPLSARAEMDRLVDERLTAAKEDPLSHSLRDFLRCFAFHHSATEARWRLAERLMDAKIYLEAEVMLTRLVRATEPRFAVQANGALAELYGELGLFEKAAKCYHVLGTRWANVAGLDGKTGADWYEEAEQKTAVSSRLQHDTAWPRGRVEVTRTKIDFRQYAIGYHQTHPVRDFRPDGYGLSDVELALDWQQMLVGKDRLGQEQFRVSLVLRDNRLRQPSKPRLTDVRAVGHLLIASHGVHIVAVDALPTPTAQDDRILWRKQLTSMATGSSAIKQVHQKKVTNAWGDERWITTVRSKGEKVRFGQLGPLTEHGLCFQRGSAIVCFDPLMQEEEPIWIHEGFDAGAGLFGDDEYLFVTEPSAKEASVIRLADGQSIGPRKVPPETNRWTTLGRNLLTWKKVGKKLTLMLYDPWYEEDIWSFSFPLGSKGTIVENRQAAILQPDGRFVVIDIAGGSVAIDQQLESNPRLDAIHVIPSRERMILVTTGSETENQTEILITPAPSGSYSPMINGKVYAFDPATGRSLWPVPAVIEQYGLPLDQPAESPVLIFLRHMRTKKERASAVRTSLLCLHKRDGRILVMSDDNAGHTGTYSMTVRPEDDAVTIALASARYHMKFTSDHVPPEPPAQTGSAASFVAQQSSSAWRLYQAARQGIESVTELPKE